MLDWFRRKKRVTVDPVLRAAAIEYDRLSQLSVAHSMEGNSFSKEEKEAVQKKREEILKEFGHKAMWFIAENF